MSFVTGALGALGSPYVIAYSYAGSGNFNGASGAGLLTVMPAPVATAVSVSPASQQYSDRVTFEAVLSPTSTNGLAPAASVTFLIGDQAVGTANLVFAGGAFKATLANVALRLGPGPYPVTAQFGGVNSNFTIAAPLPLVITPEDARAAYAGLLAVSTPCAACNLATVTLRATIRDISATPDAAGDTSPGDIRQARVTFINRDTGAVIAADVPVIGLTNDDQTKIGMASYDWKVNLGKAESVTFKVGIIVNNYYTRDDSGDDIRVVVSRPCAATVAGEGFLVASHSAGLIAADPETRSVFEFGVRAHGRQAKIHGHFHAIIRSRGRIYLIKSEALDSLTVNPTASKASFAGKARIVDLTNLLRPVVVDEEVDLEVTAAERENSERGDALAVTLWKKSGELYYSSHWNGAKTAMQKLRHGHLVLR
jgi:hypothetical protein